ncbi:hypothetical protein IWX76_000555 [Pedobacter sp. CAN_A7]
MTTNDFLMSDSVTGNKLYGIKEVSLDNLFIILNVTDLIPIRNVSILHNILCYILITQKLIREKT